MSWNPSVPSLMVVIIAMLVGPATSAVRTTAVRTTAVAPDPVPVPDELDIERLAMPEFLVREKGRRNGFRVDENFASTPNFLGQ